MEQLKPYTPSEKGRELIALLFPLSHIEREKHILDYWKQYPQEINALMDGFHYLIQEVMETRMAGLNSDIVNLPKDVLGVIVEKILTEKKCFSYDSIDKFFDVVKGINPPIFKNFSIIEELIQEVRKPTEDSTQSATTQEREFTDQLDKKFQSVCKSAEKAYEQITRIQRSLINSQKIVDAYRTQKSNISLIEVKLAKETFLDSKNIFVENGKIIAEGMNQIYQLYQQHASQFVVRRAYLKYLAKLLASREARFPPENYVINLAKGGFDFKAPNFEPTDKQLQHGQTKYSIKKEYEKAIDKHIMRLEARYRKRKLTVMLKQNTPKLAVISELQEILKLDPFDIKTHIFLAKLLADYSSSVSDHGKRGLLREQALKHCQAAFSKIDDYLALQNIKKMQDRDLARSGFVKTISSIRIPLIRNR